MKHVMIDLETMGMRAGCAIISIGAVQFDPKTGEMGAEFYEVVDLQSCMDVGLHLDASTVMWWMQQSEEARAQFKKAGLNIAEALVKFSSFITQKQIVYVWGNGADFDQPILAEAYNKCVLTLPWKFWNNRCYRTKKGESNVKMQRTGTYHSAIDDARSQALHLIDIYKNAVSS